jgi:hypothetical protein
MIQADPNEERRCGPFDIREYQANVPGPSRRNLLAMGMLAAAGLVVASIGVEPGSVSAAVAAEPQWNHPFTRWAEKTSGFGSRVPPCPTCSSYHNGIDYAPGPNPVLIHSVAAGTVTAARLGTGFGYFVEIDHGGGFSSVYAHMQAGSLRVSPGDRIAAATVLGIMGATGTATGIHLHVEIHINDTPVDPTSRIHRAPPAGTIVAPPSPAALGGKTMYITTATNGSAFLITPFGVAPIGDPAHRDLFIRLLNSPANSQVFHQIEVDIMANYINSIVR